MKKIAFALALLFAVSSCNNNSQETSTPTLNKEASTPLSNEVPGEEVDFADLANMPLSKVAEKFKGEYQIDGSSRKALIREHPEKPGLLAVTTTYGGSHNPVTVAFWYNEKDDCLSDKTKKGETTFTILKLDSSGENILEVYHDWERNETDTTVYKRIK